MSDLAEARVRRSTSELEAEVALVRAALHQQSKMLEGIHSLLMLLRDEVAELRSRPRS